MRLLSAFVMVLSMTALAWAAPALKEKPKAPVIVGEWQRVDHVQAGKNIHNQGENHRQFFTKDGKWEYVYGNGNPTSGHTYTTDLTQKIPTVDILNNAGRGWRGIYKIEGDTLTLCLVAINAERPTTFASDGDNPTTIWVFKRVKPND